MTEVGGYSVVVGTPEFFVKTALDWYIIASVLIEDATTDDPHTYKLYEDDVTGLLGQLMEYLS